MNTMKHMFNVSFILLLLLNAGFSEDVPGGPNVCIDVPTTNSWICLEQPTFKTANVNPKYYVVCTNAPLTPPTITVTEIVPGRKMRTINHTCLDQYPVETYETNEVAYQCTKTWVEGWWKEPFPAYSGSEPGIYNFFGYARLETTDLVDGCPEKVDILVSTLTVVVKKPGVTYTCGTPYEVEPGALTPERLVTCEGESLDIRVTVPQYAAPILKTTIQCPDCITSVETNTILYAGTPEDVWWTPYSPDNVPPGFHTLFAYATLYASQATTNPCGDTMTVCIGSVDVNVNSGGGSVTTCQEPGVWQGTFAGGGVVEVCVGSSLEGIAFPQVVNSYFSPGTRRIETTVCDNGGSGGAQRNVSLEAVYYTVGATSYSPEPASLINTAGDHLITVFVEGISDGGCPNMVVPVGDFIFRVSTGAAETSRRCYTSGAFYKSPGLDKKVVSICPGEPIPSPVGVNLDTLPGVIRVESVYCSGSPAITDIPVPYALSQLRIVPPLQGNLSLGEHTFSVSVEGVPSDSLCSTISADLGTFTVIVADRKTNTTCTIPGEVLSSGNVNPNAIAVCINTPIPKPSVSNIELTSGEALRVITDCSNGQESTEKLPVVYTLGEPYTFPSLENTITSAQKFSCSVFVDAIPSETNCQKITIYAGEYAVNVVETQIMLTNCAKSGSVTSSGSVNPNGTVVCQGQTIDFPNVTMPVFGEGEKVVKYLDCVSNTSWQVPFPVGYTWGTITLDPPLENDTVPGVYRHQVHVDGVPDDPVCSPIKHVVGEYTVTVASNGITTVNICGKAGEVLTPGFLVSHEGSVCAGTAPGVPEVIMPTISDGEKYVVTIECPSGQKSTVTNRVPYVNGAVIWDPPLSDKPNTPGVYHFTAKVVSFPADASSTCSPITSTLGEYTVTATTLGYTNIACYSAGVLTNKGVMSLTNTVTFVNHASVFPLVSNAGYSNGWVAVSWTDCRTPVQTNLSQVPYSTLCIWDPPPPATFTNEGVFSFTNVIVGLCNSTNCPPLTNRGDVFTVTVIRIDMDTDSDNNGAIDRSVEEEIWENDTGNAYHPGKILMVNNGDADLDGIPNYADFQSTNNTALSGNGAIMARGFGAEEPVILEIPKFQTSKMR